MTDFGVSIKGGAARGLGSIAFIRFLQEEGLQPKVIAGSSSGGLVAAMYAKGFSWQDMIKLIQEIKIRQHVNFVKLIKNGCLMEEDTFKLILKNYTSDCEIESLPIKLILFASDIKNKKRYFLEKGSLFEALHASCAYPFILPKARIGHVQLIDGDLTSSYSASYLRKYGGKKVIGVGYKMNGSNISFNRGLNKVLDMYRFFMSEIENFTDGVDPVDYDFRYNAGSYNYLDFNKVDKLVDRAYISLQKNRSKILKSLEI